MTLPSEGRIRPGDTIIFVGDSITYEPGGYVAAVRELLTERFPDSPPVVINAGVGGNTALQMLGRFDRDVLAHDPDLVVIMAGVADTVWQMAGRADADPDGQGSEPREFGQAIRQMVGQAENAAAQVALCTPTRFEENWSRDVRCGNEIIEQKTRQIERLADDYDLLMIPTGELLAGPREDTRLQGQQLHFTPDGFHPDARGHALMTLAVLAAFGYDLDLKAVEGAR